MLLIKTAVTLAGSAPVGVSMRQAACAIPLHLALSL